MADPFISPGIDLPSPTLSARLRELADFLAAPSAGRLTEEQRALSLGIARRLVVDAAACLDPRIDVVALWGDWVAAGIPGAQRLVAACFARAEEHRWREQSAQSVQPGPAPTADEAAAAEAAVPSDTEGSQADDAYLALQIADRRRFDAWGNPRLAVADLDGDLLRALLLDIAGWWLVQAGKDGNLAAELGEGVRDAVERHAAEAGIDAAATDYHARLAEHEARADAAATAIARHDWPALIALAAAASGRRYGEMALVLLTAEAAALPILLAPLRIDRATLAPLEASLAMLTARAIAANGPDGADYGTWLQSRAVAAEDGA